MERKAGQAGCCGPSLVAAGDPRTAADTSDFEELLRETLPEPESHITEPVMFVLEDRR
jgi:hypothetical protein